MPTVRRRTQILLLFTLLMPLLAACGGESDESSPRPSAVATLNIPPATADPNVSPMASSVLTGPATATPEATPVNSASTATPTTLATSIASPAASPVAYHNLTPEELVTYKPNEIGTIPIFMYHNIVTDPSKEGHLYRTVDEFKADLQWLYDRDFYLVGMNDVVRGDLDVPAGKHPVVLTFDDSSSMHLSWQLGPDGKPLTDANGEYIPTPNCAVGIIEAFAREHPDFGRTAHFSVIPAFAFSWPEYEQDEWYNSKLIWLLEHGYEIGNHTSEHQDLSTMFPEDLARNIAQPIIWTSGVVNPDDPNYAMSVLTLPYGAYPEGGWEGDPYWYLKDGFVYDGQPIYVEGVMLVCCGPVPSVFNNDYSKLWIPRIRGDDPDFEKLGNEIDAGWVGLYTSDGNPDTVTVPWPLPEYLWGKLDEDAVFDRGLTLVKYHPETGKIFPVREPKSKEGYNCPGETRSTA